jgi:hypothetical protein
MKIGFQYANKERHADGKYHSYGVRTSSDQKEYYTIIDHRVWG